VFWLASDDHDFEEVRTAHFLDKVDQPFSLTYDPESPVDGLPMYHVPSESSLHELVDRAAEETPRSECRAEIAGFLHKSLDKADSFSDWTARIMARLFRDTGLVMFSPHLPEARRAAIPVIAKEIEEPLISSRLVNEGGDRVEALGFDRQLAKSATECGFFLEIDRRRCKVRFENGAYRLPDADLEYSIKEMLETLHEEPERFSPNAALRCIVQQVLFPTAAYVAGPSELAYWAQLKPLFEHFTDALPEAACMPVVYPRAHCMLTRLKLSRLMEAFGLSAQDLLAGFDSVLERSLSAVAKNDARTALARTRREIDAALAHLAEELGQHDPTAADMARNVSDRTSDGLERIDRTLTRQDSARLETTRRQLHRLCNTLAPWRKPQERVYTVFTFLFEQGWELVPRLIEELDIESFALNEVEL
jgi:bacillithiol biosynthesis cysteine-adding enzyme BshC